MLTQDASRSQDASRCGKHLRNQMCSEYICVAYMVLPCRGPEVIWRARAIGAHRTAVS